MSNHSSPPLVAHYKWCGKLYNSNTRFTKVCSTQTHARCINIWRGNLWEVYTDGTKKLLYKVWN
jgi:hypothetical protein